MTSGQNVEYQHGSDGGTGLSDRPVLHPVACTCWLALTGSTAVSAGAFDLIGESPAVTASA
jgi:hypothetical protein